MTAFYQWLMGQTQRDDAIGDIARDVRDDDCWPKRATRIMTLHRHLRDHDASENAERALDRAISEYASS